MFSVIQGAKATPLRGRGSRKTIGQLAQQISAQIAAIDLPQVNQLLAGLIVLLSIGLVIQYATQPSINTLIADSAQPLAFRIATPLQGLKPLEEYLPKVLEQDPFRIGQAPALLSQAAADAQVSKPDPRALIANMRLVGIASGDVPTAMIEQDKQTYFLKPGDSIGGLTVQEIQKDHVILKSGDQEVELF